MAIEQLQQLLLIGALVLAFELFALLRPVLHHPAVLSRHLTRHIERDPMTFQFQSGVLANEPGVGRRNPICLVFLPNARRPQKPLSPDDEAPDPPAAKGF